MNDLTERIYSCFSGVEAPEYCLLEQSSCFKDTTLTIYHWGSEYPRHFKVFIIVRPHILHRGKKEWGNVINVLFSII